MKTQNVLLTANLSAKVADLGEARGVKTDETMTAVRGRRLAEPLALLTRTVAASLFTLRAAYGAPFRSVLPPSYTCPPLS